MLVLSRKPSESILISDQIRITVVKSSGKQVRLAIDAPDEVPIMRAELVDRAQQQAEPSCAAER